MRFSANQNTYERIAIAGVSSDASGSYSYSTSGTQGIATIDDSVLGRATIGLNCSGVRTGSYVVTAESDPGSVQSGSFEQQGGVEEEESLDVQENAPSGVTSVGVPWNGEQPPAGTIITHNALWRDAAQFGDGTETSIYFTHDPRYSERRVNDRIVAFVWMPSQECYRFLGYVEEVFAGRAVFFFEGSNLFVQFTGSESRPVPIASFLLNRVLNHECT